MLLQHNKVPCVQAGDFGSWGNSATMMWCTVHPCDLQNLHIGGVIRLDDHSPILLLYVAMI